MNSKIDVAKIMADITCDVQERYSELAIKEREKNMYEYSVEGKYPDLCNVLSQVKTQYENLNTCINNELKCRNDLITNEMRMLKARAGIAWKIPTYEWKNPILRFFLKIYAKIVSKFIRPITVQQNDINDNITRTLELMQQTMLSMANWSQNVEKQRDAFNRIVNELVDVVNNHREVLQYQEERTEYISKIIHDMNNLNFSDEMYLNFENMYRGTQEEVMKKQEFYIINFVIPYINKDEQGMIIDIGCGRGEWLSVLAERGYTGIGVDLNEESLKCCEERNIKTLCMDGIDYLKTLPSESVKLLTSFQLVEHISTNRLLELMSQIARVMRKEGVVIIETPNPANVNVGANTFYIDPTHKRPIPSELLKFLAEENKLSILEIAYWQQDESNAWWDNIWKSDKSGLEESSMYRAVEETLKKKFWISPDYALIAKK